MTLTLSPPGSPERLTGGRRTDPRSAVFATVLWLCLTVACVFLLIVLAVIVAEGWHRFDADLVSNQPSRPRPETAGVTIMLALPLGIGAAIYLEEYADNTKWWNQLVEAPRAVPREIRVRRGRTCRRPRGWLIALLGTDRAAAHRLVGALLPSTTSTTAPC